MADKNTQRRAICPACHREQALRGIAMVQHGYTRPGWGANHGECYGTSKPHFGTEGGRDFARELAVRIHAMAEEHRAAAARISFGAQPIHDRNYKVIENPTPRQILAHVKQKEHEAEQADAAAADLEARVAAWAPREPRTVEVEKRVAIMHSSGHRWGGKLCAASAMGARGGMTTSDRSKVTCTKCLNRLKVQDAKAAAKTPAI